MLKLKRVEIQGFKSFCDRTEMRFPGHGMSAVVGPNGCGKSNLSDAISWVLGEQSARSLRGARMEDVIFIGTRERKPLGMAQVTMTLVDPNGKTEIPGLKPDASKGHIITVKKDGEPAPETSAEPVNGHANGHGANGHPAPHHPSREQEITITRRLFRNGESEYLINGRHSRLRDIQDLFMGTGLGPESYAIIEQGRVGQILSSKPLDRRGVIEEAAGISKYKTKRRLAEAKLEGAKQNLTRVFDILEEVGRQVNSLKRQASKARRFEELKAELGVQLRAALSGRHFLLAKETARVQSELEGATALYQMIARQVDSGETALHDAREEAYQTEANLTARRTRLAALQVENERARGQVESQAAQTGRIEERLTQSAAENESLGQRLAAHETEQAGLAASLEELAARAEEARERMLVKNAGREQLQGALLQKEQALEQSRQQVVRLLGEASALRNQAVQIEGYLASLQRDSDRVRRDEESATADLRRLETTRNELSDSLAGRQLDLESIGEQRKRVEEDLAQRRAAAAESRRGLDTLKSETSRLRARRDSLDEILSHRAYTTESVKRLFTAIEAGQAHGFAPAGVLADFIELTDPKFEKATEEFLHEELEYVVVRQWDDAQRGIDLLRSDLDGRATFLVEPNLGAANPIPFAAAVAEPAIGPETGIVGRLSDGLRFTNGLTNAPAALLPRLARCFLAEDRAAAQRLALHYPELYFLLPDGVCHYGYAVSGGKKTGAGPLALKRELRELTGVLQTKQGELVRTEDHLQSLERDIHTLTEELERLRAEQQRQERETLALDHEMRKVNEDLNRVNQRLSSSRLELERISRETERANTDHAARLAAVEEKEQTRAALESTFEAARAALDELRLQAARLAEEHSVLRVELAGLEERRRSAQSALDRLLNLVREVMRRREELVREADRLIRERSRLLESNATLGARVEALAGEIAQTTAEVAALAAAETAQRAALVEKEEALKQLRLSGATAQEKRSHTELELVRRQSELKFLDETSRKELGLSLDQVGQALSPVGQALPPAGQLEQVGQALPPVGQALPPVGQALSPAGQAGRLEQVGQALSPVGQALSPAGQAGQLEQAGQAPPPAEPDEISVAEAEDRVAQIRGRIEALGPVNPEAWTEFQESQQRYDFLNTQRQDLLDSIRDTEKAIHEIDIESRKRFKDAFEAINEHFKGMFTTLFGGGSGEMRLTGEGDLLDAGIEIVAQPPGKKLQNVMLLSGGEKALTAVALLMAIFKYTPSPFCILDEVDAPLDEANVDRFTQLVKAMANETQFIVITHAKKTMEAAESLYGVTMQEQGVSKLVSVRLNAPPPPPMAASAAQVGA